MDLADVTRETFVPHVGTTFGLRAGGGDGEAATDLALVLREVTALPAPPGDRGRPPFNLLFRGPAEPLMGQATYPLTHPELGALEIFIVPIGRGPDGVDYEAVFT